MSNEAKFTKGEWKILDKYQVGISVDFGDGFFTLASCQVFSDAAANAHLIAAAPEMYEMLKELADRYPNSPYIYEPVNKVLAKARGE